MSRTRYRLEPRPAPELISLIIPVYNEEAMLPILRRELTGFMNEAPFAVQAVLVNDGSGDDTTNLLAEWAACDTRVRVLELARNFGHQAAVTAGLDFAGGDAVVILDADLQDPLEVIPEMVGEYRKGFDVVYGRRTARAGESAFKRFTAWAFYRLMRLLIHPDLPADAGDFRLISRRTVQAVAAMREMHRFLRGMVAWVGFPQTEVRYVRRPRAAGSTKYPFRKMLCLAWTASASFSPVPLRLSLLIGGLLFLAGLTQAISALIQMTLGIPLVRGWTSLIIVNCVVGGSILMCIGVLGEYVGRIFEEVKGRPLYIVASTTNVSGSIPQQLQSLGREIDRAGSGPALPINAISRK